MDNDKFQSIMLDQMAWITQEITVIKQGMEEIRRDIVEIRQDIAEIRQDIAEIRHDITDLQISQVRMENRLSEKIDILFDARKVQEDVNERLYQRMDELEKKIEVQAGRPPYLIREDDGTE